MGWFWQEPELSQATDMALARCIPGKFLGVVCHCFPLLIICTFQLIVFFRSLCLVVARWLVYERIRRYNTSLYLHVNLHKYTKNITLKGEVKWEICWVLTL
jgi:hypothetical protein